MLDVQVGTPVWVEDLDRRVDRDRKRVRRGQPGVVVKVGRKYITVAIGSREEQFEKDTLCHADKVYGQRYQLWATREACDEWAAAEEQWQAIRDAIRDAQFIPGETDIERIGRIYNTFLVEGLFEKEN